MKEAVYISNDVVLLYRLGIGMNDIYINHFLKTICTFTPLAEE